MSRRCAGKRCSERIARVSEPNPVVSRQPDHVNPLSTAVVSLAAWQKEVIHTFHSQARTDREACETMWMAARGVSEARRRGKGLGQAHRRATMRAILAARLLAGSWRRLLAPTRRT